MSQFRGQPRQQSVIIFDMDGTLTRPVLDFDAMRREIGIFDGSILESVLLMEPEERARAEAILDRHERVASESSELQPDAELIVHEMRSAGHPVVLMTRNSRTSLAAFQRRHAFEFDMTWTREDGPMKPSPEPVLLICRRFDADPREAVVIGDFHFDIMCGNAAGATTVLFLEPEMATPDWVGEAGHVIRRLLELRSILELPAG